MAAGVVGAEDRVAMPVEIARERLRDGFLPALSRACLGLVQARATALAVGPLVLLRFGEPRWIGDCWSWSIEGGLLARRPIGRLLLGWRGGQLVSAVVGYAPRLPVWLYRLTQLPLHHLVTRRALRLLAGGGQEPREG